MLLFSFEACVAEFCDFDFQPRDQLQGMFDPGMSRADDSIHVLIFIASHGWLAGGATLH